MNIVTGYPGATHDARVWCKCSLNWDLEDNNVEGMLLGDSAYPLRRFLVILVSQKKKNVGHGRCECSVSSFLKSNLRKRKLIIMKIKRNRRLRDMD